MTSPDVLTHSEVTFTFTSMAAAAEALLVVLEDSRKTDRHYTFTGLTPSRILKAGLTIRGEVADIDAQVALISGAVRHGS